MHHRLGYDLPDRTGFGGLWSAMDVRPEDEPAAVEAPRQVVAHSDGATCRQVRASIAAFFAVHAVPDHLAA